MLTLMVVMVIWWVYKNIRSKTYIYVYAAGWRDLLSVHRYILTFVSYVFAARNVSLVLVFLFPCALRVCISVKQAASLGLRAPTNADECSLDYFSRIVPRR